MISESPPPDLPLAPVIDASMGPRSNDLGKAFVVQPGGARAEASMGPRSNDLGKRGAAGKCGEDQAASMGPRSNDLGKGENLAET